MVDGLDRCPGTPAGAIADAAGCPIDSDKDGVPDGLDKCPNTPPGVEVDDVGCQRFRDSDGDGVDDARDKCPGTPAGTRVDAAGCPILFTPERTPVILRGVIFETGKSALKPESFRVPLTGVNAKTADKAVAPGRMVSKGYGAVNPIATNTTALGRAQNRRVELRQLP